MKRQETHRTAPEARLNRSFAMLALLGAVLVVAGLVGLVYVGVATVTSVLLFGCLLLVGGTIGLVHAVQSRKDNMFWLGAAVAAINIAAGLVMVLRPNVAAVGLTLFAALLFLTAGTYRLVGGLAVRGPQLGWTIFLGVLDLALGALVLAEWPSSSLYTLGAFFSLALLFDGLGLISTGLGGRRVVGMVGEERRKDEVDSYLAGREAARGMKRRRGAKEPEQAPGRESGSQSGSQSGPADRPPHGS